MSQTPLKITISQDPTSEKPLLQSPSLFSVPVLDTFKKQLVVSQPCQNVGLWGHPQSKVRHISKMRPKMSLCHRCTTPRTAELETCAGINLEDHRIHWSLNVGIPHIMVILQNSLARENLYNLLWNVFASVWGGQWCLNHHVFSQWPHPQCLSDKSYGDRKPAPWLTIKVPHHLSTSTSGLRSFSSLWR